MCRSCPEYLQLLEKVPKIPKWFKVSKEKEIPEPERPSPLRLSPITDKNPDETLLQVRKRLVDLHRRDEDEYFKSYALWLEAMKILRYLEWRVFYTDEMFKLLYPGRLENCSLYDMEI